jgi:hypothetical protein
MVDIQTISIMLASASVIAGVVYYALQIRHQTRIRKTDLLVRLYSTMTSKDWLEAWEKFSNRENLGYDDYREKYGFVEFNEVYLFFDEIGNLLQKGLINIDLLPFGTGQAKVTWEKIKPLLEVARKKFNEAKMGQGSEYLYNELKKREQRGVNNG